MDPLLRDYSVYKIQSEYRLFIPYAWFSHTCRQSQLCIIASHDYSYYSLFLEIAKWVLDKCITIRDTPADHVTYDYRFLEKNMDANFNRIVNNSIGENPEVEQSTASSDRFISRDNNYIDSVLDRDDNTGVKFSKDLLEKHTLAVMVNSIV